MQGAETMGLESGRIDRCVLCAREASAAPYTAGREALPGLVGRAPPMLRMAELVRRLAPLGVPVLLRGESGSGKELVARALHRLGPRAERPFVAINAATLASGLDGSALFGHVAGAFTGAAAERMGAFRSAHGGTLFIDEVAALPLEVQATLLRAVEEKEVLPIGSDRPASADVRLVAATCEPLEKRVARGVFRADLYQRLAGCVVRVPPLRERWSDLPLLCEHLLASPELAGVAMDADAWEVLRGFAFPGNVRELANVLVQAALGSADRRIRAIDVAAVLEERGGGAAPCLTAPLAQALLVECGGNLSAAARRAGLPRSTFRGRLRARPSRPASGGGREPRKEARSQKEPAMPRPCTLVPTRGTTVTEGAAVAERAGRLESTK